MLQLSYTYFVHDTVNVRKIRTAITNNLITHPLYLFQIGECVLMQFDSNEDAYAIDDMIASEFHGYEFITDLSSGKEKVLLSITRIQHMSSGDGWGRPWNDDGLISEKHLVKKRKRKVVPPPYTDFAVFFGNELQKYEVHLAVIGKGSKEERYVVVDGPFGEGQQPKTISSTYTSQTQAFWAGNRLLEPKIQVDFEAYQKAKKPKRFRKKPE